MAWEISFSVGNVLKRNYGFSTGGGLGAAQRFNWKAADSFEQSVKFYKL